MLKLSIFVSEVIIMKKVALITGGSRGIGAEIVNVLANNFDILLHITIPMIMHLL